MQILHGSSDQGLAVSYLESVIENMSGDDANSRKIPMVFFPGWGSDASIWHGFAEAHFRYHDCYFVDLPGFGVNLSYGMMLLDAFLAALSELLPCGVALIGWSLGGMLACEYARRHPTQVLSVATFATNARFLADPAWTCAMPKEWFESFVTEFGQNAEVTLRRFQALQVRGDSDAKYQLKRLRVLPVPSTDTQCAWLQALTWLGQLDHRAFLAKTTIPTFHVFGENDHIVPSDVAGAWPSSAWVRTHVVKNRGHCLPLADCAGESFISEIKLCNLHAALMPIASGQNPIRGVRRKKCRVAKSFSAAAATYEAAADVQARIGNTLLALFKQHVGVVPSHRALLDVGCGTGVLSAKLDLPVVGVDIAHGMLQEAKKKHLSAAQWVCGDVDCLPFECHAFTGVISNLCLQWSNDLPGAFAEIFRVLVPGGWCLISTLGPNTLHELKAAWTSVDDFVHVNEFESLNNVRDAILSAGFSIDVASRKTEHTVFDALLPFMRGLKAIGAHNVNPGQSQGLMPLTKLRQLEHAYEPFRDKDGRLIASYDVIYVLARKPDNMNNLRIKPKKLRPKT